MREGPAKLPLNENTSGYTKKQRSMRDKQPEQGITSKGNMKL